MYSEEKMLFLGFFLTRNFVIFSNKIFLLLCLLNLCKNFEITCKIYLQNFSRLEDIK